MSGFAGERKTDDRGGDALGSAGVASGMGWGGRAWAGRMPARPGPKRQLQASCGPAASPAGQLWAGRKPPRHLAPTPAPPPAAAVLLAQQGELQDGAKLGKVRPQVKLVHVVGDLQQ